MSGRVRSTPFFRRREGGLGALRTQLVVIKGIKGCRGPGTVSQGPGPGQQFDGGGQHGG